MTFTLCCALSPLKPPYHTETCSEPVTCTCATPAGKDAVPDDVFRRLRGALFFGPGWRVTRNKLMFRDNLGQALAGATPGDRHLERRLREWLAECHSGLDRIIRFEKMPGTAAQVCVVAVFERMSVVHGY